MSYQLHHLKAVVFKLSRKKNEPNERRPTKKKKKPTCSSMRLNLIFIFQDVQRSKCWPKKATFMLNGPAARHRSEPRRCHHGDGDGRRWGWRRGGWYAIASTHFKRRWSPLQWSVAFFNKSRNTCSLVMTYIRSWWDDRVHEDEELVGWSWWRLT